MHFFLQIFSIFKDGLDCVEEAVDAECGSDAADHQLEIEKSYLRPRAEAIDCDLGTNLLSEFKGGGSPQRFHLGSI